MFQPAQSRTPGHVVIYDDVAAREESVPRTLRYTGGYLSGHYTDAILVDGGSAVNLVNQKFVNKPGLHPVQISRPEPTRVANGEAARVDEFLMMEVVVVKIMCHLAAYVMKGHEDWDPLVRGPW
ncbi:hypothetical protein DER44DRAFT_799908 [Fusarium oxysporum]|nr:hypothetical protein DER44DRAFT_799908 [Fusarium oxysporum]